MATITASSSASMVARASLVPTPKLGLSSSSPVLGSLDFRLHLPSQPRLSLLTTSAADTDTPPQPEPGPEPAPDASDDPFESRLSNLRIRYRSGTGKKAEIRKTRKSKTSSSTASASGSSNVFLPPVPLKKARDGGFKVEFGFTPYSEALNGRIAGLGLAALLAVELATGKGVINYHSPSIVFLQVYFMAAASALYLKFQKEKVSIWPPPANK